MGTGPKRIDTQLCFGEDLYSMYFASTFRPELVYYHMKVAPGLQAKAEEMVNEAKEEKEIQKD